MSLHVWPAADAPHPDDLDQESASQAFVSGEDWQWAKTGLPDCSP